MTDCGPAGITAGGGGAFIGLLGWLAGWLLRTGGCDGGPDEVRANIFFLLIVHLQLHLF